MTPNNEGMKGGDGLSSDTTKIVPIRVPIRIPPSSTEKRTRRLNLIATPSTCAAIAKILYYKRNNLNNLVNFLLDQYVAENKDLVERYNKEFPDSEF